MKKMISMIVLTLMIVIMSGCAMIDDGIKDIESDTKELNRHIEVYDNAGNVIFEGEGVVRVSNNEYGNKVIFQLDGKRLAFYNATVKMIEIE